MKLINSSSVVDLRITVPDQNGEQVRLKDCDSFYIKLYTTDPMNFIEFDSEYDSRLQLKGRLMRKLQEGVIHLEVSYRIDGYSGQATITTDYYFGKVNGHECEKDKPVVPTHVSKWGEIQGDVSKQKDLTDYISIQIDKNIVKMKWSQLTKDEKDEASKLIGADLAGFTNVLTEDEYQRLVDQNKVDPNVFYFTYDENE